MGFSLFGKRSATSSEQNSSDSINTVNGVSDEHNEDSESNYVEYSTKHNLNQVFGANASKWIYPAKNISGPGGEYELSPGLESTVDNIWRWMYTEWKRPKEEYTIFDPEGHRRVPEWIIDKNIAIDGTPLTEAEVKAPNRYEGKYAKELALADVHMAFKEKRFREQNTLYWNWLSRLGGAYGLRQPITEQLAEELTKNEIKEKKNPNASETNGNHTTHETKNTTSTASSSSEPFLQTLSKHFVPTRGTLLQPAEHEASWSSPWEILLESVSSGKPLIKVANQYRPRIDFYSIDGFIDSAPSFIWFWCKFGLFVGLVQGAVVGFSAIKSEYMYFYASGLSPFAFLNSSIIAGMLKWGGNYSAFAIAFCMGDRFVHKCKQYLLPTHEQNVRTCANYVTGMSCVGATVGVMPWWLLNDYQLAGRMAISGMCVGGLLGVFMYYGITRMTAINMELYDATDRDWRRYEALMLRQRNWREMEKEGKKRRTASGNWI